MAPNHAQQRSRSRVKIVGFIVVLACLVALIADGYRNATASPTVRRLDWRVPDYPDGAAAVRLVLLADLHVHGPDMPPSRVAQIVAQVNSLRPDVVILAGDFVGNNWVGRHYSPAAAIAPLAGLRARLGDFAVLGNNDHIAGLDAVASALRHSGIRVLDNQAVQVGPLAIGGLDDRKGKSYEQIVANEQRTFAAMRRLSGPRILVAHGPDEFVRVPRDIPLMIVGHTHCGQIALPFFGPLITGSDYGRRFACGIYRVRGRTLVVSGGVGTSHVPLRFEAPPDIWVIEVSGINPPKPRQKRG